MNPGIEYVFSSGCIDILGHTVSNIPKKSYFVVFLSIGSLHQCYNKQNEFHPSGGY